jgi:RepB plasmid partitioning protein/ParB-like nuclease domain
VVILSNPGLKRLASTLPIASLQPLHLVSETIKKTRKYAQIVSSIQEIGIIEPPVVARIKTDPHRYLLLDGHLRIEALKDAGQVEVSCLISTDDEAFTYNKRVNRLAIIQEHRMILKAIERGVPEARIASALKVDTGTLRHKMRLLDGICPEAAELLKDKHVASNTFWSLRRMVPIRQIEAADLMIAMNKFTASYASAILAATPESQLVNRRKGKAIKGLSDEQIALMERESSNLEREFKIAEQSYGTDHLDLVLAKGYLAKLLRNARVVRYLAQHYSEYLSEFQKVADIESLPA